MAGMSDLRLIPLPLNKGRCFLVGRRPGHEVERVELENVLLGRGWSVSTPDSMDWSGQPFDIILVENPSRTSVAAIHALKVGTTIAAAWIEGLVNRGQLDPYDVLFTDDLSRVAELRALGKAAHFIPSGSRRAERIREILERHRRYAQEILPPTDPFQVDYGHAPIGRHEVSEAMTRAWQSEEIPVKQRFMLQDQLRRLYHGQVPRVFESLAEALRPFACEGLKVLEIGCASGYYYEILEYLLNCRLAFEGADYSEPLIRMARDYYPGVPFHAADGAALPFGDKSFEVAISSGILLHVPNWADHVRETARVADRAVIAARSPICRGRPTHFMRKFAYGQETVELVFNEEEFLAAFARTGLKMSSFVDVGSHPEEDDYCLTYTFEKQAQPAPARRIGLSGAGAGEARFRGALEEPEGLAQLLLQGEAAFAAGDRARAGEMFRTAASLDPDHPRVLNNLGVLALESGDSEAGLQNLRRAYDLQPTDSGTLENLVLVLSAMDRAEEALNLLDRHLSLNPDDGKFRALRETVIQEAGLDQARSGTLPDPAPSARAGGSGRPGT